MPGIVEAVVFSHLITRFEVYERLVNLDERIVLRWLIPGKPGAEELGPDSTKYHVWVRPKNSTNVKILGGGHLVRGILISLRFWFFFGPNPIKTKTDSSRNTTRVGLVIFFFSAAYCVSDSERYS